MSEYPFTLRHVTGEATTAGTRVPTSAMCTDCGAEYGLTGDHTDTAHEVVWTFPVAHPGLVEAVKGHAVAHYDTGGWDVIVECWDDDEIAAHIGEATTVESAIAAFGDVVDVWADRQAEADYQRAAGGGE